MTRQALYLTADEAVLLEGIVDDYEPDQDELMDHCSMTAKITKLVEEVENESSSK